MTPHLHPVVLLGFLCLSSVPAASACQTDPKPSLQSQSWIPLTSRPGLMLSIDTSTITRDSGFIRVWLRSDLSPPHTFWKRTGDSLVVARVENQEDIDCRGQRIRDRALWVITTSGKRVEDRADIDASWLPFVAHPLSPQLLTFLCVQLSTARKGGA